MSWIVVFGIGTRQGCKLFKVVPPHLILVALIWVCIIIGSLDWVIEALRQINWFLIKFKSTVYWLSLARFFFQSSKFGHHISVWQIVWESIVVNSCIQHWHKTGLQTFWGRPSSSCIGCLDLCLYHYWKFGLSYRSIEVDHLACHWSLLLNIFHSRGNH